MWYSTVTRTGPRSFSIARVVTGAAQCIDGEKSTFAPVCNFHRQVSRIATIAPAAARNRAAGSPAIAATSPQIALPRVSAPNMTVTYIASPRPRTHSGNATWAETFRVDKATVHDAPATRLAATAVTASWASAPATAEAPMAPSSVPYNAGPPAI